MKKKKYNLLLLIFIILSLTGCKVETVKEHNKKVNSEKKNQSSLIESLKSKEETTKAITSSVETTIGEQSSLNTTLSNESSTSKVQSNQVTSNNVGVVTGSTTVSSVNASTSSITATVTPEETTTAAPIKEDEYILVNLKIECEDVNESRTLNPKSTIPENGVIIDTELAILKGNTVFDALKKTTEYNNIAINYTYNASFKTAYITSINNLSALSNTGWTYYVNGVLANVGCSKYILNSNDSIIWKYIIIKQ